MDRTRSAAAGRTSAEPVAPRRAAWAPWACAAALALVACGGGSQSGGASSPVCGNGTVEAGEECDLGGANAAGGGCEPSCAFSCTTAPDSCPDADPCDGEEVCTPVTVAGGAGRRCEPAAVPAVECTPCPAGLCVSGACQTSTCGDGCVDVTAGETCEPPGAGACDGACHAIAGPSCGDGVRDAGEACDDGGTVRLDGCDATCGFEQVLRINFLKLQFAADTTCTANALGGAFAGSAQTQLQAAIDGGIADGSISIALQLLQLDDLGGSADPQVTLGILDGTPVAGAGYSGTSDLDWWYTISPTTVSDARLPRETLNGAIAASVLTAGPGALSLPIVLGGVPATLALSGGRLAATVGAASTPLASAGAPPGHLASEHLDPALRSFASLGEPSAGGAGALCGAVSAASLAAAPIPASVTSVCTQYTGANTFLDLLVGGCTVVVVPLVRPTQPDGVDPAAPVAGAGGPYRLTASAATRAVTGCRDRTDAVVDLATCLRAAAYSSYFRFAAGRIVPR